MIIVGIRSRYSVVYLGHQNSCVNLVGRLHVTVIIAYVRVVLKNLGVKRFAVAKVVLLSVAIDCNSRPSVANVCNS